MFEAKIILDSVCEGQRLTTMQLTHPRIVHSEFNTHCMFARNASSSRAIPFKKAVQFVQDDPFIPEHWGINQSGMQASAELTGVKREHAIAKWLEARDKAVYIATYMSEDKCRNCEGEGYGYLGNEDRYIKYIDTIHATAKEENRDLTVAEAKFIEDLKAPCHVCGGDGLGLNVHKQIVNRLIEPWSWITVCVTGDAGAWSNYFSLRCHPDAQPDIQKQAYMAQRAWFNSTPQVLEAGQWHTPYIKPEEVDEIAKWSLDQPDAAEKFVPIRAVVQISTGRCARTSYLTQEGTRDFAEDVKLHDRLRYHTPLHASPFEHVCLAMGDGQQYAKYTGWKSYRHMLPREYVIDFQPNYEGA